VFGWIDTREQGMKDVVDAYRRAQELFDRVLAAVPANSWGSDSACTEWTVKDVAGHVIWGQNLVRHWATGREYTVTTGAPGSPQPAEMAGDDPLSTWRSAREDSLATLTPEALAREVDTRAFGVIPVAGFLEALVTDHLAHAWDVGHPLGLDVPMDADLVRDSFAWSRTVAFRAPGGIGPELTPPDDADEQTCLLAFLGRQAWTPVPA
jgi:uncharacterized protein (TIGR03086 family)